MEPDQLAEGQCMYPSQEEATSRKSWHLNKDVRFIS